jgi:hypothetical protein
MLYLLVFGEEKRKEKKRKKKEKGEMARGLFPWGQTHPCGCATLGFPQLLGAIVLKVSP